VSFGLSQSPTRESLRKVIQRDWEVLRKAGLSLSESAKLEGEIRKNLAGLGFELMAPADEEASA
jgi:hypothetical protein